MGGGVMSQQTQLDTFQDLLESLRDDNTGGFGFPQKVATLKHFETTCRRVLETINDRATAQTQFGISITNAQLLAAINPIIAASNVMPNGG